jgi:hypothetical protein
MKLLTLLLVLLVPTAPHVRVAAPVTLVHVAPADRPASPAADGLGVREDGAVTLTALQGWATYFDAKAGTAAAGPLLRSGDWRGRIVTVCAGECVVVRLTDWCACRNRHGKPTLLDLAKSDFARLVPPSQGVVWVAVGRAELPATDLEVTP